MKKFASGIMIIALSGLVVLGVLYPFRDAVIGPFIKNAILAAAKRQLGLELAIQRVRGNYLTALEIDQVRTLRPNSEGPLISVQIGRLSVHYSLLALFEGKNFFFKTLTLELQGARVEINLKAQTVPRRSSSSALINKNPDFVFPVLPLLPHMLIQDTIISFQAPFINIPELHLESRPTGANNNLIHIACSRIDLNGPIFKPHRFSLETDLEYTPGGVSFKRLLFNQTSVLETAWFHTKQGQLQSFKLDLRLNQNRLAATGKLFGNQVIVGFAFTLPQFEKLGAWVDWPILMPSGAIEARGQVNVSRKNIAFSTGAISLHWINGLFARRPVDRLDLTAMLKDKTLFLNQAALISGINKISFQQVTVPITPLVQGHWGQVLARSGGLFSVQVRDIPLLLAGATQNKMNLPRHSLTLQGEIRKGELRIQRGVLEMPQGTFTINRFTAGMKALESSWFKLPFDAEVSLQANDLAPWATLLGIAGLKGAWKIKLDGRGRLMDFKASAHMQCSDLSYQPSGLDGIFIRAGKLDVQTMIQGSIQQPRFTGQLSLEEGQVKLSPEFPDIRDIQLKAGLNSMRAVIQTLSASVGGSPLTLAGTVDDFFTPHPKFDLHLQGSNLLLYRSEGVRFRADTDIVISGPLSKINISGKSQITDGLYNRDLDFLGFLKPDGRPHAKPGLILFSLSDPPFDQMHFAVQITSAVPFRIKNNAVTGAVRPELFLGGTGELPVLTGAVYMDPTLIALPTGILTIQSGVMHFLENFPDIPRLDILAQTKMQGYAITLKVTGPYDKPLVTLSSLPPAPNDQLLLLVLTGQSPQSGQRFVSTGNLALYFGQGVAGLFFGENSREILDRLQFSIGQNVSRNGNETLDAQFQIAKNWLSTRDAVYFTSQRDIYDDYNAGAKIVFQFK
jgi:hypothetical protein